MSPQAAILQAVIQVSIEVLLTACGMIPSSHIQRFEARPSELASPSWLAVPNGERRSVKRTNGSGGERIDRAF